MGIKGFETPVLFIIFNKPESTKVVFDQIKKLRPKKLYIAADGPRKDRAGEKELCDRVREIVSEIDWDCEHYELFQDHNLGCARGVSGAIDWLFRNEERGIIVEDDVLPDLSFFHFCDELLEKYNTDTRVMGIGGTNFFKPEERDETYSYYFSNENQIWGWATWRRAWQYFELDGKSYRSMMNSKFFRQNFTNQYEYTYKKQEFERNFNDMTAWSYQWYLARIAQSGLFITPTKNLIKNIGIGDHNATHTGKNNTIADRLESKLILEEMDFPLKHPDKVMWQRELDSKFFLENFTTKGSRIRTQIKKLFPDRLTKIIISPVYRSIKKILK